VIEQPIGTALSTTHKSNNMSEQPSVIKQAEDAVGKVAASVAETLNFSDKEAPAASNPGKLGTVDCPGR
jgi:hypothetical protein